MRESVYHRIPEKSRIISLALDLRVICAPFVLFDVRCIVTRILLIARSRRVRYARRAGYTAGLYLSRASIQNTIIAGPQQGGQLTDTHEIENYPGFPDAIGGYDLMQLMEQQAVKFGTQLVTGEIVKADFSQRPFQLTTDSGDIYTADDVIV